MSRDQETAVKWLGGLSAIVGAWLVIAPFVLGMTSTSAFWNEITVGIVALILGLSQLANPANAWPSWVNLIAAIWLIASPYMFNPTESVAYTNAVVSGLILGALALSDGLVIGSTMSPMTTTGHHRPT